MSRTTSSYKLSPSQWKFLKEEMTKRNTELRSVEGRVTLIIPLLLVVIS